MAPLRHQGGDEVRPFRSVPILGVFLIACSKEAPTPAPIKTDEALPYRSASATEVFRLRSECAKLGENILEGNVVGPAMSQDVTTHYNAKTNRCYAELIVMPINLNGDASTYLYDGQTKELLAYHTVTRGKKAYMNLVGLKTDDPSESRLPAEEQVLDAIGAAMDDDRKS